MKFVLISCVAFIYLALVDASDLGPETIANSEIQSYATQLRTQIEAMASVFKYEIFKAVLFRSETVDDGYNFFVKIRVAFYDYIHARIHKDLSGKVTLNSIQTGRLKNDPIEYF